MTWEPIDTAPKDGTIIVLYRAGFNGHKGFVVAGGYDIKADIPWRFVEYVNWDLNEDHDFGDDPFNAFLRGHEPTHWMPLPEPPETKP